MWVDLICGEEKDSGNGASGEGDAADAECRRYCDDDDNDTDTNKRTSANSSSFTTEIHTVVTVDANLEEITSLPTRGRAEAQVLSEPDRLRLLSSTDAK
jgi:hypothetical protein